MKRKLPLALLGVLSLAIAVSANAQNRTWTLDEDFDEGTLINVNHDAPNNDQLQVNEAAEPFPFINVAASARGTIVRIDTDTGQILGEYRTAPQGRGLNPSRTTVDLFGNVWAGNRDEVGAGRGSVVKIGLVIGGTRVDANGDPDPNGQFLAPPFDYNTCVDRDGDGFIKTSRGLGDILSWPDITDGQGGTTALVEDAEDECVLIFQRVEGDHVRHVSVDANNDVWAAGNFGADNAFDLLDGETGQILASFDVGGGGYGGLVDGNAVLWSANRGPGGLKLLRYDTNGTIPTGDDTWGFLSAPDSYGLGIDSGGNIWHAQFNQNFIRRYAPGGAQTGDFPTFGPAGDRGVAVTPIDDNVWVANSGGSSVSRLDNNGTFLKEIQLGGDGQTPTGVAVDSNGQVWATCLNSNTAKRIDPNAGGDGLGAVNLTVSLGAGAGPYNYSDMTGAVLLEAVQQGTWTVVWDSEVPGNTGCRVFWTSDEPSGTAITVEVRAAETVVDLVNEVFVMVDNDVPIEGVSGRYWEIRATLSREPGVEERPILFDLSIQCTLELALDIKPGSCPNSYNRRSNGVLPVALPGTEDFDVHDVDLSTVRLSRADSIGGSVAPHEGPPGPHTEIEDVAAPFEGELCDCHEMEGDGLLDLSMKFKTQNLVEVLELNDLPAGDLVELVLTGMLLDGTSFAASDCVRLVPPGRAPGLLVLSSGYADAWIDVTPLDLQLDGGGFGTFERTYPFGTVVILKAAPTHRNARFVEWQLDGLSAPTGPRLIWVVTEEAQKIRAVYGPMLGTSLEQFR